MTDSRPDRPIAGGEDPLARQPLSSNTDQEHPISGYGPPGPGYRPPPQFASSPSRPRPGLIVAVVVGLVVVLAAGVMIGVLIADGGGGLPPTAVAAPGGTAAKPPAAATTTPLPEGAPGPYSMNAIADACDLVDPTPLHKWSAAPDGAPYHHENPPSADAPGSLSCQFGYKSQSADGVHWNQAAIDLRVEFTAAGAAPAYDQWKHEDATGPGAKSGEVSGIGSQGYWYTATADSSDTTGLDYVVGVQDGNVSVRVRIPVLRQHGEPAVDPDELGVIARDQARRALEGLERK
ncbi:hypothetical protein ACWCPQ_12795 [Nocardia sp. NPDC001965]